MYYITLHTGQCYILNIVTFAVSTSYMFCLCFCGLHKIHTDSDALGRWLVISGSCTFRVKAQFFML